MSNLLLTSETGKTRNYFEKREKYRRVNAIISNDKSYTMAFIMLISKLEKAGFDNDEAIDITAALNINMNPLGAEVQKNKEELHAFTKDLNLLLDDLVSIIVTLSNDIPFKILLLAVPTLPSKF